MPDDSVSLADGFGTLEPAHRAGPRRARPAAPRLGHQPPLDGLRALAVVLVLLYHGGVGWASGGFLGVDIFFVISGFLISWLLIEEHASAGSISVAAFYGRRARRLLPAATVMLLAVAAYGATLAPNSSVAELRGDIYATLGYVANWRFVLQDRGYFDTFGVPSPLKHTWSLALEEQWYLVWPPVLASLLIVGRRVGRPLAPALAAAAGLCVASAVWAAALHVPGADPSRVYYGTDTRVHELLVGAVLALVLATLGRVELRHDHRSLADLAGVGALAWVLWLGATVDDRTEWLYEGGLLAIAAAIGVVLVAVLQPGGWLRRALSLSPLCLVGRLSYSLYLWHFPTYVVLSSIRTGLSGGALLALRLGVTGALSAASYLVVERPALACRWSLRRVMACTSAGLVGTLTITAALVVAVAPDSPPVIPTPPIAAAPEAPPPLAPRDDFLEYDRASNPPPTTVVNEPAVRVLLTGDSVARTLAHYFVQRSGTSPVLLWDTSIIGCSLFTGDRTFGSLRTDGGRPCEQWRADQDGWLRAFDADVVAVLSDVWETYDRVVDDAPLEFGTSAFDQWFDGELDRLVELFSSDGAPVALLSAPCNQRAESITGVLPPENHPDRIEHLNERYRAAVARHPGQAAYVDLNAFVCPGGLFVAERDGVQLRHEDGVHFAPDGADLVRRWLLPQLAALARTRS